MSASALETQYQISPKLSVVGGLLSMGLFFVTVSFMFTTPGVIQSSLGFPAITVPVGQFLLKGIGLFAASLWIVGESLIAVGQSNDARQPDYVGRSPGKSEKA